MKGSLFISAFLFLFLSLFSSQSSYAIWKKPDSEIKKSMNYTQEKITSANRYLTCKTEAALNYSRNAISTNLADLQKFYVKHANVINPLMVGATGLVLYRLFDSGFRNNVGQLAVDNYNDLWAILFGRKIPGNYYGYRNQNGLFSYTTY